MTVRCKFTVSRITRSLGSKLNHETKKYEPAEMWTIEASPVYGNGDPNHENTKFWDSSPGGSFQLNCVNADAVRQFDIGKEYYFDISPA